MTERPIIKLDWTNGNKDIEGLVFLALVLLFLPTIYYFPQLSERIPRYLGKQEPMVDRESIA
jgi:hypothetical protein